MTFSLTEDQTLIKDAADGFFGDHAPVSAFRTLRDAGATGDPKLWSEIGAMGFTGALISEDHGGTALGYRTLALVLEAQAKGLGASPLFQTGWCASQALYMFGDDEQISTYMPGIAAGEVTYALAWDEGPHHKAGVLATGYENGVINGRKRFVPDGTHADHLLVAVTCEGGIGLALIEKAASGVTRTALHGADNRDLADIVFENTPAILLGRKGRDQGHIDGYLDSIRMGIVAEMMGLTAAAYEMTLDYLKTRTQFGQLIGSFQALQHRASAMLVEMELSRSCAVAGFDALEKASKGELDGQKLAAAVSLAKARAGDTMHLVTNEMIQMHGGIGMTDAHDSGFYLKRARVLETLYGSSAFHRDRWAKLHGY
jgi:alkylation response protein AidB-like acyl-CoA dehydrogenase